MVSKSFVTVFISESRLFWFQANSVRARGPERTSGTGTRTNIRHGNPNEHQAREPERTSGTGTRTNIRHGNPNEYQARGPERTKGVFISESRLFWFQANSVRARGPERTSGTGTRTNIRHGNPNEHQAREPERTSGTGTRTNIRHGNLNEQRVFLSRNRGCFGFKRIAFGHGDPNEHQAREPERTSGTGT